MPRFGLLVAVEQAISQAEVPPAVVAEMRRENDFAPPVAQRARPLKMQNVWLKPSFLFHSFLLDG